MDYGPYLKANARNYTDINAVVKDINKLGKTYKGREMSFGEHFANYI